MEKSWQIDGAYATYRMTIGIDPPEGEDAMELVAWKESDLDSVVRHFQDCAMLWDMWEERERMPASRERP